ncbi:MAG: enolase C-terminal domain-like protein [Kiloniellales bacterium]|nr:enolase C-terminal domain-like protein [Kiloniellales bacterium]
MKTPEAICVACRPAIEALKTGRPAPWELNYVDVAPHHDCFIHAHLVGASPAGRIVESFPEPERDPLPAELFENPPRIADGWLTLNGAPGLGLSLSPSAMRKFGQLVFAAVAKAGLDDPPPLLFP